MECLNEAFEVCMPPPKDGSEESAYSEMSCYLKMGKTLKRIKNSSLVIFHDSM